MRKIDVKKITDAVKDMCIKANCNLNDDVYSCIQCFAKKETIPLAKDVLNQILENADYAKEKEIPICQDTGMAVFFVEVGQEVSLTGGDINAAINEGVRLGYRDGYLRKSVVSDPLGRTNTKDNTPAIIYYQITEGDKVKVTFLPKGFGSENMSAIRMLKPSQGVDGVIDFVVETVKKAGSNPCPPVVVGVGIGGTFDYAALLSKKALARSLDLHNQDPFYAELENTLLEKINQTGIGPQGFGGRTTALKVNVETFPTHIAGLPVAVNISCHVTRHAETVL